MRDDALRQVSELRTLKAGRLTIAAHESAAVYLLPAPLRNYLQKFPNIKVGIQRSRLAEIPRQVMDREVDVGFVKDEPAFHELHWVEVSRRRDGARRVARASARRSGQACRFAISAASTS